jgi:hypothetical protein
VKKFSLWCAECGRLIPVALSDASVRTTCPHCPAEVNLDVFPALLREAPPGQSGERLIVEEESSCFYHPAKKAVVPCDSCGRFLCSLCDIEMHGQHLCPACIESGVTKGKLTQLKREYVHYDDIALTCAILPIIFVWPTIVTAPITFFVIARYWKRPLSVARRSKWRYIAAGLAAGIQVILWGWVLLSLFSEEIPF